MPDAIWLKIAKNGYWDTVNLDKMNSQALANLFADAGFDCRFSSSIKSRGMCAVAFSMAFIMTFKLALYRMLITSRLRIEIELGDL